MVHRTQEEEQAARVAYEDLLIRRHESGLPLTASDRKEARRLIKDRQLGLSKEEAV